MPMSVPHSPPKWRDKVTSSPLVARAVCGSAMQAQQQSRRTKRSERRAARVCLRACHVCKSMRVRGRAFHRLARATLFSAQHETATRTAPDVEATRLRSRFRTGPRERLLLSDESELVEPLRLIGSGSLGVCALVVRMGSGSATHGAGFANDLRMDSTTSCAE